MPILDKIKEAENQVEELKTIAKSEVAKMLEERSISDKTLVNQKMMIANEEINKLNQENKLEIEKLQEKLSEETKRINQENEQSTKTHLNEAIDFIMKKVMLS